MYAQITQSLQALLTPLIAVVATYIAWQQWKTNRQKLILDRYDRRLRIYKEVVGIISLIVRDANANAEDLRAFRIAVSEADFLFGPEISAYVEEICQRGANLWRWNQEYRDCTQEKPEGYDHSTVVNQMHKELGWFADQFTPAKKKFKKYLDISQ